MMNQDFRAPQAVWEPVAQVGGQQEGLVAIAAQEVVGHGLFYAFATFIPNAFCFLTGCCLVIAQR